VFTLSITEKIIQYRKSSAPISHEDLSVIFSTVEYDHNKDELNYILFDMVSSQPNEEPKHFYKAIKLYRLLLVPKNDRIANFLMEKQAEVLASMWEHRIHFISLIANILDPAIGLVYTYGVQGVGQTIEQAKQDADLAFSSLSSSLKGTFRTIRYRRYNYEEAEWLRKKMIEMKYLTALKGIPYPHQNTNPASMTKGGNAGGGTAKNDIRSQTETMEEFISGMTDHEYVMLTMANPIHEKVLKNWLQVISREETKWASILQGSSSVNFSIALPMMFGGNLGGSEGNNTGTSHTAGHSVGQAQNWTDGVSQNSSHGVNSGVNHGTNSGYNHGVGTSHTVSNGTGTSHTVTDGTGTSHTTTTGHTHTNTHSNSSSSSNSTSWNNGSSSGYGGSQGTSSTNTKGSGSSFSETSSYGKSNTTGWSVGVSEKEGISVPGFSASVGLNEGYNGSVSNNSSFGHGHTDSNTISNANGTNSGTNWSDSSTNSYGGGSTTSSGVTNGYSDAVSSSTANGTTANHSVADGTSTSKSTSNGNSTNESWANGTSDGTSNGTSDSWGSGSSQSWGGSNTTSNSVSNGTTSGNSSGWNVGTSASMAIAPGLSIGKSYQWKDAEVENVLKVIDYQKERLMRSLNGQGAFFVDTMIATTDEDALHSAMSIAKGAFYNKEALASPLQVLELKNHRKEHLLYHFNCFSPCLERDDISGMLDSYTYSSVLLSDELTAYTHPPRLSFGGLYADIDDMPQFSVPSHRRKGDIYVGKVLSGQVWSEERFRKTGNGHLTEFPFKIFNNELMHALFQGESRSGKSETALRVVAEASELVRPTGKKPRILVFDQKNDWRKLYYVVDKSRFRFYQMDSFGGLGLKLHLFKVAPNVHPEIHIKTLVETFVSAYGLGILGSQIMKDALLRLYDEKNCLGEDWVEKAHINSRDITFEDLYAYVEEDKENAVKNGMRNISESYERVLMRLKDFARKGNVLNHIFSRKDGLGIHELLGKDDITVIEAKTMDRVEKNFVYGLMFSLIYSYGVNNGTFLADNQYETILVVEEANAVLRGSDSKDGGGDNLPGQSRFEDIVDQSAGNGMFVFAITQSCHLMPSSILNSCGIWFIGRTQNPDAHAVVLPAIGKNVRYDYKIANFLAKAPTGWFIVKTGRVFDFVDSEPTYVGVDPIIARKITDENLVMLEEHKRIRELKEGLWGGIPMI
jgi:hypothetical protein